ncbi:MAG: radical SAM protein [Candidatus Hydrogenedentes bacterium]|nr:radical SAM protein [Candidatus Hydrogenedentota bacterium]
MKVLLLNPYRDKQRYVPAEAKPYIKYTSTDFGRYSIPPLDLAYLAGALDGKAEVSVLDAHAMQLHPERIDFRPYQAVAVNTAPYTYWRCTQTFVGHVHESLRAAKAAGCRTVVYGPHASIGPDDFVDADCVISGEPDRMIEEALFGTANRLGPDYPSDLPQPDFSKFDFNLYDSRNCEAVFERRPFGRVGVLAHSRGCPYNCGFCFRPLAPRKTRGHSIESTRETLRQLVEVHQCKCLFFEDLTFTLNKKRTLELCEVLMKYRVPYVFQTRTDAVDEDIAAALVASGCYKIEFGVESGNEALLTELNKGNGWDHVERAVRLCRKAGIPRVVGFAGIFAPGETLETIRETRRKFHELGLRFYVNLWFPYPHTSIFHKAVGDGMRKEAGADWTYLLKGAGTYGNSFTTEEVRYWCDRIAREEWWREKAGKIPVWIGRASSTLLGRQSGRAVPSLTKS